MEMAGSFKGPWTRMTPRQAADEIEARLARGEWADEDNGTVAYVRTDAAYLVAETAAIFGDDAEAKWRVEAADEDGLADDGPVDPVQGDDLEALLAAL